jgi:hypothetical protein
MTKKEMDPSVRIQLIVGILGLVGVLLTVFVPIIQDNLEQKNLPTQTPIIIVATPTVSTPVPTDTVPPGEPTSTPAPNTPTPEPTFTFTPTAIPLEAGQDWLENCIGVSWQVYPESTITENDGKCYKEPVAQVFAIQDQHFSVFFENKVSSAEIVGMFVEVPSDSTVEINMHIDKIDVGELWVGVLGAPNFETNGLVIVAPSGNANNSAFSVRTMPDGKQLFLSSKFKKENGDYLFSFDVAPNTVAGTLEKYTPVNPVPVPSDKKYLFIGYRALFGNTNHIEGNFFDLKITPR